MDDLRKIIASNIVALRRSGKLTQGELAEKLNYSDKAVSKWERAESMPDIAVLKQIADMFGVTVDYLLSEQHSASQIVMKKELTHSVKRNRVIISMLSASLVWLIATLVFVNLVFFTDTKGDCWIAFIYAIPISSIVILVFNTIWGRRRLNFLIVTVLVWTTLLTLYLTLKMFFDNGGLWLIFILGVPGQLIIFLWAGLDTRARFNRNIDRLRRSAEDDTAGDETSSAEKEE